MQRFLFIALISLPLFTSAEEIAIHSRIAFEDNDHIADNVRNECTELGRVLAKSIVKYGKKYDFKINRVKQDLSEYPVYIDVKILTAISGRQFNGGHAKSATVKASLYMYGQKVDDKVATRNSGGGFFGQFKTSCSVLEHTVNTLGADVAKWMFREHKYVNEL